MLTAARVAVTAANAGEWLATLGVLAARLAARGQHLWVFRQEGSDDSWLEFTEGPDELTHRCRGPADDGEAALETRLRELASYDVETSTERWIEVRPGTN